MTDQASAAGAHQVRDAALHSLTVSAVANIPGVDFASVTLYGEGEVLSTAAETDPVAKDIDELQYRLREGPCYDAVTRERVVMVNDVRAADRYPQYSPRAVELGVRSQAAIQLVSDGQRAGLNLYSRRAEAFDSSTVQLADLFATHAAFLLEYVDQVEQLSEALHTRTDIGTAVGIVMERFGLDRDRAFAYLVRQSNHGNIKIRDLALTLIDGTWGGS